MGPNIQYLLFLHSVFYVLSMNVLKLLHPLTNHMPEVLDQINLEEHSLKSLGQTHKNSTR